MFSKVHLSDLKVANLLNALMLISAFAVMKYIA